ncbi:MAG: glycosyltransferase [Kiritimatiellae bacterium]|nr:glycosyltransferase [Kiritimatiellia bacterium]
MKLSVIVPSLTGVVPDGLHGQLEGHEDVELVVVSGICPVGRARNEGLRRAHGAYIAWVDSDDAVSEDWLESILGTLDRAAVTGGRLDGLLFDAEAIGWQTGTSYVYGGSRRTFEGSELAREIYRDERLKSHLWRWVLRRELWEGESFDEEVTALEDYLVLPKVVAKAKEIEYLPRKLYQYHYQEGSAVNRADEARDAASVRTAIHRYRVASVTYKKAALWGTAGMIYWSLNKVCVDNCAISPSYRSTLFDGRKFIARHLWGLWSESDKAIGMFGMRLWWMARFVTAALGWWGLQRWRSRKRMS